ncbi:chondroadherin-like protein [Syngnathoides biaculeatus]|uniref:chondroadherin-like protein n=1 Tax=Syngnathoides biaculeatus TaxID=300417 RepID=UPI002ADE68F3|nr:chondroadherin-like protein [Syngnathoides biaculeatus]
MKMLALPAAIFLGTFGFILNVEAGKCPRLCSCDNTKLAVACVGKNLTEVPLTIDEIAVKLDLRNNNLQVLQRGGFVHTPYLTHLNLQRCNIIKVKEGAFRMLGRVVSLNLAYNKIDILYQESFDGLSSLKELHLDHNRVEEIQPGAFLQLGSLNMLALTHNQLVYIPNMAFQGLQHIKWLRLSHNSINNLAPEAFASLFTLTRLSLDHNELQFFPTQAMTRLKELTRLNMSHNPMIYLGEESVSMAKLTHLYLSHMSLQDLSDQAMSQAPLLSHLDLSHNQLRYLDPLVGPKNLTSLNLTANPIYCSCYVRPLRNWASVGGVKLLGTCAGPPHLSDEPLRNVAAVDMRCRRRGDPLQDEFEEEVIAVSRPPTAKPKQNVKCPVNCDCHIEAQHATCENRGHTKVPRGFPAKTQLLDLRSNHFHNLPANSFPASGQVISLHLEFCKIHEIEGGAFRGMKKLFYLYLTDNDLTSLGPETFTGAPELSYLYLEGNRLAQFPGSALQHLPNLFALHLERNAISKLVPTGLLSSVTPKLRELYLTNNTIRTIAKGALDFALLGKLHLDSNKLTNVPTAALSDALNLEELNLSQNRILSVGPNAFRPISRSLKWLHTDQMSTERMSPDALAGLGPGLKALTMRGNQLKALPDLGSLTGLEVVDLHDNPLLCDCTLLPLRRWLENVSLEVGATCGLPPQLKGRKVRELDLFKSCPENSSYADRRRGVVVAPVKSKKQKLSLMKTSGLKSKPERNNTKRPKPTKKKPQRKPALAMLAKKKKLIKT